jgi:plasmid stability protein
MATLYVENVPDDLYESLRSRARRKRKSIASEVIQILQQLVPTAAELKRRHELYEAVLRFREQKSPSPGPFQSTEEMIREDRER